MPGWRDINWGTIDEAKYERYIAGEEVDGLRLSAVQISTVKAKRKLATTFQPGDLQGDELGKAPFANQGIPVDEFGVRWWFQYFWQEAKMVAGEADRRKMADICNRVFVKTPAGPMAYRVRDAFRDDDAGTASPVPWLEMMTTLLHIGFRAVEPGGSVTTSPQAPPVPDRAGHHLMLRSDLTQYFSNQYAEDTEIFWRAESRTIDRIIGQGGTKRQADVAALAADMNISKPWHPFSRPEIRRFMWYRNGQSDNDYYTVISVATSFETALGFPKINELRVYGFPARPVEAWSKDEARMHRANLALVSLTSGERKVMLATRTTAYMCVACGRVIDTMKAGGGFPEKGVMGIGLDQIFAYLPITRIHFGPRPEDGFSAFPDVDKGDLLTGSFSRAMDLFGAIYEKCCTEYFKAKYGGPVVSSWTGGGPAKPPVVVPVSRVLELPIGSTAFDAFHKSLPAHPGHVKDFLASAGTNIRNVLKPVP